VISKVEGKEMLLKDLYSKWDSIDNLDEKTGTQNEAV